LSKEITSIILKKCFNSFKLVDYQKNNGKETVKSVLNVLSDGIYLLTMFALIMFLLPFFVYVYLNLFYKKNNVIENMGTFPPQNEPEEDLQEIHLIALISPNKTASVDNSFESNFKVKQVIICSRDEA
jgi:hypothetical protein